MKTDIGDMTESITLPNKKGNRKYIVDFWIYCILIGHTKRGEHKLKGDVKYLKNINTMFGTWAKK